MTDGIWERGEENAERGKAEPEVAAATGTEDEVEDGPKANSVRRS
jgi:hypothetical protein